MNPKKEIRADLEFQHGGVGQGRSEPVAPRAPCGWETGPVPTPVRCSETPLLGLRHSYRLIFWDFFSALCLVNFFIVVKYT